MRDYQSIIQIDGKKYTYIDLKKISQDYGVELANLPYTIRILLESLFRKYDGLDVTKTHLENLLYFNPQSPKGEVPFKPSRVILQDFTGVPVVVDLAAMRQAVVQHGGNPDLINPEIPVDLVIDHSVQVDVAGCESALSENITLEFERNDERYAFLKWAEHSFENYRAVPPATGIIHQVNIVYL